MLNTILFYGLLLAVVGVPFYFQLRSKDFGKNPNTLSSINSLTAKLSAFVIVALYVMSFLSFEGKNGGYSKVGFCACLFSFFLLYSFRGKVVSEIREIKATPKEKFEKSFRTFVAMGSIYAIYLTTVHFLIPVAGTLPAVAVALIFITYSTPLLVRVWMPTQKMHPSPMKDEIKKVFAAANSPVHEVYLIDTDRFKTYNALVCGPKYGFGALKRSVFVTKNLFEILEPSEIYAVMAHEAAHFKLHHIFKRGFASIAAMIVALLCVFLPLSFITVLLGFTVEKNFGFLVLNTVLTLILQISFIFRVIRKQEFEADIEATRIGATPAALSSALEKITFQNGGSRKKADWISRFMFGQAHPELDDRIRAIQSGAMPANSKILPAWKYTVSYASFVIALGTLATLQFEQRRNEAGQRNIASAATTPEDTRQELPTEAKTFQANADGAER